MNAPFVAAVLEGAVAALAATFALATAPTVFRSLPPEHAGRTFAAVARRQLAFASALAAAALVAYVVAGETLPAATGALVCFLLLLTPFDLRRFERARAEALADVPAGAAVPAAAVLASHGRLRALRIGVGVVAFLALVNVWQTSELLPSPP